MQKGVQQHLAALAGFVSLTLLMTLPVATVLTTHLAGTGGDPWQTMWRFENTWRRAREAVAGPEPRGVRGIMSIAHDEFFRGGEPRLVNLSVWPWLPMHALFGQPLAFNLAWLMSFILSGYAMYIWVRWLTDHNIASILAGAAYMFLPYHVAHAQGHFGAMQLQWLPLAALACASLVRRPGIGAALALVASVTVQAWTEHHYALWLAILGSLSLIFFWSDVKRFLSDRLACPLIAVIFVLLFFFVVLPYWPTLRLSAQSSEALALGAAQTARFSADPFAYVAPASWHPIWGGLSRALFGQHFTGNVAEATHYIGLAPLLLVVFFQRGLPVRARRFWITAAVIFLVISFGPRLHLLGRVTALPLPWALVDELPVFSAVRAVARAGAVVGLAVMTLFGLVLSQQLRRRGSGVVMLSVILLDFLFMPAAVQSAGLPRAYAALLRAPGDALIELPAATNYVVASRGLYGSLTHDKRLVGNIALERGSASGADDELSMPMLRQLLFLRTQHLLADRPEFFGQEAGETILDVWRWIDARTILVHRDSLSRGQLQAVERLLSGRLKLPREEIGDALVFTVPEQAQGDGVFAARDKGWQQVGFDPKREATFGEVPDGARLILYNVDGAARHVAFSWRMPENSDGVLTVRYHDALIAQAGSEADVRFQILAPPGRSELIFNHEGSGRSIVQNPRMRVTQGTSDHEDSAD